jgi:hypothetical protein
MKHEFGSCALCESSIANSCPSCGTKKANDRYTEVLMKLNNGSQMVIAICVDCAVANAHTRADKVALMNAVKAAWLKELSKSPKAIVEAHNERVKELAFVD